MHTRLAQPGGKRAEWLVSGMTTEKILADYEDLEREDILAVLSYAAHQTAGIPGCMKSLAMRW